MVQNAYYSWMHSAGDKCDSGIIHNCICMDISETEYKAQGICKKLREENTALTEDSPIGLWCITYAGNSFEPDSTNREYYAGTCGQQGILGQTLRERMQLTE